MTNHTESDSTDQRTAASSLAAFGAGGQSKLTDPGTECDGKDPDAEKRGRIKHHAHHGRMGALLRTIGATTQMNMVGLFAEAGIESPADLLAHHNEYGDFRAVESVGPATSVKLEEAVPHIRAALEEAD